MDTQETRRGKANENKEVGKDEKTKGEGGEIEERNGRIEKIRRTKVRWVRYRKGIEKES